MSARSQMNLTPPEDLPSALAAEGDPMPCNRLKYALEANQNGAKIEIVTLDELLSRLGTSREELESAATPDVSYLMDEKYAPMKNVMHASKRNYVTSSLVQIWIYRALVLLLSKNWLSLAKFVHQQTSTSSNPQI